jgi:EAL domain-containing protein (putative c-di-GMP-specific phosphodiesterase class I)
LLRHLPDDLGGFQVEITENELVPDAGRFRAALEQLRERGAQIAVDDVGEGYAGLQRVMSIRPDVLKLDRSLVSAVDSRPDLAALLEAVVRFAGRVGAQV